MRGENLPPRRPVHDVLGESHPPFSVHRHVYIPHQLIEIPDRAQPVPDFQLNRRLVRANIPRYE
jgi:hypothetical protein